MNGFAENPYMAPIMPHESQQPRGRLLVDECKEWAASRAGMFDYPPRRNKPAAAVRTDRRQASRQELVEAAALLVAEIQRIDRARPVQGS
jgi:hypothetical protein